MGWIDLNLNIDKLTHTIVNQVNENSKVLRDELVNKGYTVGTLINILAEHDTQIIDFFDVISGTDDNIGVFDDVTGIGSVYYEPWNVGEHFTVDDYNRWVMTLIDLYDIIMNGVGLWRGLVLSDGRPTIDGKRIIIRDEIHA